MLELEGCLRRVQARRAFPSRHCTLHCTLSLSLSCVHWTPDMQQPQGPTSEIIDKTKSTLTIEDSGIGMTKNDLRPGISPIQVAGCRVQEVLGLVFKPNRLLCHSLLLGLDSSILPR